jgi:hypothetical protein
MPYIGNPVYQSAFVTDTFSGNGSTVAFTMSVAPASSASVLVAVSGVLQTPSTYGVAGNTLTFSGAPPSGTGNISVRYLGIPVTGISTTAYRTVTEFTATAGQTTFTPPSYTVGFISVYRNGVLLGSADYTATNGTTVVLATGATAGDLVIVESFLVSSVLNAIPATAGSVANAYLGPISTLPVTGGYTAALPAATGTVMVSGNMPAFGAYKSTTQSYSANTYTKVTFDTEEFDTNNNFASNTFTPTVAGYYQLNVNTYQYASSGVMTSENVAIYKNGSSFKIRSTDISSAQMSTGFSAIIYANGTTDYFDVYVLTSGTSPVLAGGQVNTWFNGCLVRSA